MFLKVLLRISLILYGRFVIISSGENAVNIKSVWEFEIFVNNVNLGTNYSGTTVYLDSGLSFSGHNNIAPIGKGISKYFRGVFDGQGHIISNLKISSYSQYIGLFGYSKGLTIRNVVLDSSCSITSSYSGSSFVYVGGIVGDCWAYNKACNIENSVNMADVAFSRTSSVILGGVAASISSFHTNYSIYVKNCANYGSVTHSEAGGTSCIGGVVGDLDGFNSNYNYVYNYNCLNYGTITYSGTSTSTSLYLGGIAGYSRYAYIENCVSAGKISTRNTPSDSYIGSIVGYVYSLTHIHYCYYTNELSDYNTHGGSKPESTEGTPTSYTNVDLALISNLNNYASSNEWNKWLLNTNNEAVRFKMNGNESISLSSTLIILPDLVSGWRSFVGWFTNTSSTTPFTEHSVSGSTTLYGRWDTYLVTFNANGGSEPPITSKNVTYNSTYGDLPIITREGYVLYGWFTERTGGSEVASFTIFTSHSDHTLYARWDTKGKLTFVLNNGEDNVVDTLRYNDPVKYPDDPEREGYTFDEWDINITNMPAYSFVITALWIPNIYTVTLDFGNGTTTTIKVTFGDEYGNFLQTEKIGHTVKWFTESNKHITNETIVTIPDDHTLKAHYTLNNYTVTFIYENETMDNYSMVFGTPIEFGGKNPQNTKYHKFDTWCTKDGDTCLHDPVPARDISLYPRFTINAAAASGAIIGSLIGIILLVFLLIVLVMIMQILKGGMEIGHESIDVELSQTNIAEEESEEDNQRIVKQMETMTISNNENSKLEKILKGEKNRRTLNEILIDIGIVYSNSAYGISESFKLRGVASSIVNNLQNNTNLDAVGYYLRLLFTTVREQEDFVTFEKLYFGMKDVNNFKKKDGETIGFEGIWSGFTNKKRIIRLLSEGEEGNLPRGVLFKVQNGKGYDVGFQGEVLFEMNSAFSIERVKEVIKDRYVVVKLSYTSPSSEDERVKISLTANRRKKY